MSDKIVRTEISETRFGFYTDREKKNVLSTCHITSPLTLNVNMQAVPSGLYDGHMGPMNQGEKCLTCGSGYANCQGHPGHIELDVPVYHPLLFPALFQILRSKCFFCHGLRMSKERIRFFHVKMKLIEMGEVTLALELNDLIQTSVLGSEEGEENEDNAVNFEEKTEQLLRKHESKYNTFIRSKAKKPKQDLYAKSIMKETIEAFQRAALAVKKCENCGCFSPPLRKDGYSKIFRKPIPKRLRKSMSGNTSKLETALDAVNNKNSSTAGNGDDSTESSEANDSDTDDDGDAIPVDESDKFLVPLEVEAQLQLLWKKNRDILDFIWKRCIQNDIQQSASSDEGWELFFTRVVLVTPNKFRPAAKVGDTTSEHPQNIHLIRILEHNSKIRLLQSKEPQSAPTPGKKTKESALSAAISGEAITTTSSTSVETSVSKLIENSNSIEISKLVTIWIDLQNSVNCYIDSAKDPNPLGSQGAPTGIRQLLERKEGLFRRHMMGKRVNYCCRSVISPDNFIGTNEIGIPIHFAMQLHYPTPVNEWNAKYLRTLVERGPKEYPGANQIETADGRIIKLEKLSAMERAGKAKLLLSTPGNKVYRHLIDGDVLLVNRQPTLQKPGIMAHKARVLRHIKEQTLRMHYANCNTYNADFDGDEMNCHFVQSELARAEASYICNNDNQYIGPTAGNPLRGLIQDHVAGGVKLTCKDTFLTRAEFQQLLYIAVTGLSGTEIVTAFEDMVMPLPAIWKPKPMWTGKQVISALMAHMCRPPLPALNLDGKARTPATAFGAEHGEHEIMFRHGELLCGVLDKNSIGSVSLGVVHAVYELYGAELAGRLLNAFGRLFTYVLQDFGLTCGISDLMLNAKADEERRRLLKKVAIDAEIGLLNFLKSGDGKGEEKLESTEGLTASQKLEAEKLIAEFLLNDKENGKIKLDGVMQGIINKSATDVIKACLPNGLQVPFLTNNFSIMVLTGAKGSAVNQSQISCFLGQQALEGQRVPLMISGKSLPSFKPYDSSARAGGFVQDRFLTGVKPQEYYFHCMAGREGLVDTAVKTSRSGYLQRCLVKHLEELKIHYDNTVRDSGGNVVQFLYGEDGLDPIQASLLGGKPNQMLFLARNYKALVHKFSLHQDFFNQGLEMKTAQLYHAQMRQAKALLDAPGKPEFKLNSIVQARRKLRSEDSWVRGNIVRYWVPAQIVKCREKGTFDLKYADGVIEKKVPVAVYVKHRKSTQALTVCSEKMPLYLIKAGLPDTALSTLRLDTSIGAVSESIQDCVVKYTAENKDDAVSKDASTADRLVSPESLELLVWVKYMRSMACPGEAVGCIAAQSVGEPSTQMTLNTFHLAGHGGANVTLGIPRLREIIMTASKTLKTPTMLLPFLSGSGDQNMAKQLARQLSRIPLSSLLSHKGGVEVGEYIDRQGVAGMWERKYRIRLLFERPADIEKAFGLSFKSVVEAVEQIFMPKLEQHVKAHQRKMGEKNGKTDSLSAYRSAGGDDKVSSGGTGDEDGMEVDNDDDDKPTRGTKSKTAATAVQSDEDEDDDEDEEADLDGEMGTLKLGGSGKETMGYDDSDDKNILQDSSDSDNDDGDNNNNKVKIDSDDDDDNLNITSLLKKNKKSVKKTGQKKDSDNDSEVNTDGESDENVPVAATPKKGAKGIATKRKVSKNVSLKNDVSSGYVELEMSFPATTRRLLMAQIVEKAASATMVQFTKDITNAYALDKDSLPSGVSAGVMVEGINFEAIWALSDTLVDMNNIKSNDIYRIMMSYGVEAARACIVQEIKGVFGVYGIDVNPRHLSLIADFMTRNGQYAAMNRMGMYDCSSPFLQMSFETTCTFLTAAAIEGSCDVLESPSSRIVMGSVTKVGTGCFDLMLPLGSGAPSQ